MRIRAVLTSILGSVTVLVIGWQAGAAAAHNNAETATSESTSTGTSTSTGSSAGTATSTPSSTATSTPSSGSSSSKTTGTYVGATEQTRFGPMQVEIVVSGGKITDVKTLQETNQGGRSVQISNYAVPILRKEVLAAQSANVSSVGGATYTSQGYLSSLQSAIDKAGL